MSSLYSVYKQETNSYNKPLIKNNCFLFQQKKCKQGLSTLSPELLRHLYRTKHHRYTVDTHPAISQIISKPQDGIFCLWLKEKVSQRHYQAVTKQLFQDHYGIAPKRRVNKPACHHGECVFLTYCSPAALPTSLGIIDGKAIRKERGR